MYSLQKINDVVVKPIKVELPNPEEIAGYNIIPLLYAIIFLCAKKGSGKTNAMFTIMKNCIDKNTIVIVFCSTYNSDTNWIEIRKYLEKKKQPHKFFGSIYDENDGSSNLDLIVDKIKYDDAKEQEEIKNKNLKKTVPVKISLFDDDKKASNDDDDKSVIKKKGPKYLFVFDDISNETRSKHDVQILMKHMRHYKCKIILASQFPTDLDPASRGQIDFWCMFKGFAMERMKSVYPQLDVDLPFDQFYNIYKDVTKINHDFLYINRNQSELRKNFNQQILIKSNTI